MRTIVRFVRQFQSAFRRRGYTILSGLSRKQNYLASTCSVYRFSYNAGFCRYSYPYMISRALFADAAKVANGEVSKAGPLVQYERRIEACDLVDGHNCQKHKGVPDPLEFVAGEISDESILLCFDEFMVADALILNRLFGHLFSKGVILVATSNRAPDNLYEGGLQRDLFLPFNSTLKERCVVLEIGSSTDYQKMTSVPLGANRCAYFPFEELCNKPLGAADYFGLFCK